MAGKKVWITDYFNEFGHEESVLGPIITPTPSDEIEVIIVWHTWIGQEIIDSLPNLKGIIRYGVGFDNVDIAYAASKGIPVCNNPDYGTEEVADTAIAMIMNINRGITEYDTVSRYLSDGTWQENVNESIKRTSETKLGIVGVGRIGGSVANRAKALRFPVHFFDPYVLSGVDKLFGATRHESLKSLLETCDIITIHTPLNDETEGMINTDFLNSMKRGASLVNVSRGGILNDINDLYEPLKRNEIRCVGLDVIPEEPPKPGRMIDAWRNKERWLDGRLIINPHTAYYSQSAYDELRNNAAKMAKRVLDGEAMINQVN